MNSDYKIDTNGDKIRAGFRNEVFRPLIHTGYFLIYIQEEAEDVEFYP